jgi:hypothetical protein
MSQDADCIPLEPVNVPPPQFPRLALPTDRIDSSKMKRFPTRRKTKKLLENTQPRIAKLTKRPANVAGPVAVIAHEILAKPANSTAIH